MVLLADAVSKHEQRQWQAERQRAEERAVLGQDQRNGIKRISIRAANTTQREDNTPQVQHTYKLCHSFESPIVENNVLFYIYDQKSIGKVTVTFPGDGFWFFYCYKRSYKWSH